MKSELESMQLNLLNGGAHHMDHDEVRRKAQLLLEAERMYIAQKTKITYLQQGKCIQDQNWNELIATVTVQEIENALNDIDDDKAPDTDGFGPKLSTCIGELIDGAQAASVQRRSIVDNIHLAQELLRKYARKRSTPRCLLKVDLEKAYDTVDWTFLKEALVLFNFHARFVDWIMECVTTTSYSVVINGAYHGHFEGKRGLRQAHVERTTFQIPSKMWQPQNYAFSIADDLLLLSHGDRCSVGMIMQCLNNFGDMAGLRINALKSNTYMASVEYYTQQDIIALTGFSFGTLPFRYLGVPFVARQLRAADYSTLIDNVSKKHPPIAWSTVCKPLADGGLGLKNMKAWNRALLAKTLWNIHCKKDRIWIKWVNHVYGCFGDIWNWRWHKDESPLIKNILSTRDEMVSTLGSVEVAVARLQFWFGGNTGLARAYDFFVHTTGLWPWKPLLAKNCILPEHKFVLWLFAHSKLLTRDHLAYISDHRCVLCHEADESVAHLFFKCRFSKSIWDRVRCWIDMKKMMSSTTSILRAFRTVYRGNSVLSRMRLTALATTVYLVWNVRNKVLFENEKVEIDDVFMKIKIHTYRCVPEATNIMTVM
ncbi:uncharacterized protein [Primulina eburnea]|uniref:uncharacterized protein n=1 Tax=Primulina eburnea TaxID=1245227 RepID=UPI003C6CB730